VRARAATVGVVAVLAAAVGGVAVWLAHPRADVRYAGAQGAVRARVDLQLAGAAAPDEITVDLGSAGKIVAHRLR
jgi:hypothetical protein